MAAAGSGMILSIGGWSFRSAPLFWLGLLLTVIGCGVYWSAKQKVCPLCGARLKVEVQRCKRCGHDFSGDP
jgi:hypothetical protein